MVFGVPGSLFAGGLRWKWFTLAKWSLFTLVHSCRMVVNNFGSLLDFGVNFSGSLIGSGLSLYWLKLFTTFFTVATVVLTAVYVGEICGVALVTVDIHAVIVGHVLYYAG